MRLKNIFLWFFLFVTNSAAQDDLFYKLDEVVVTTSRIPSSTYDLTRNITVITKDDIKAIPMQGVHDILNYYSGVDSKQRGPLGVQTDISIRGGSFEQTLILIDGVKLSDPQTAHHNLNLPLNSDDISRIEILRGHGSKSFGANAFSGIINIITDKGRDKNFSISLSGGQNNYYNGSLSLSYPFGSFSQRISLSRSKSDGYRYNTHFENFILSYGSSLKLTSGQINFSAGYNNKEFGANSFYSSQYPDQWEQTKMMFLNLGSDFGNNIITFSPRIFWRKHNDDYILDFNRPEWYRNLHKTNSYGVEIQSSLSTFLGVTSIGGELTKDEIRSTNLGNHQRTKSGVFIEQNSSLFEKLKIIAGVYTYKYDKWGWKFWPGIDVGYNIFPNFRVFASAGKSFRIPSFTELFYTSPAQTGNTGLKPEEAFSYETGAFWNVKSVSIEMSIFRREGKNLIDWVRSSLSDPWTARNILKVNTNGFESGIKYYAPSQDFFIKSISIAYTYLDSDKKYDELESRYILENLKHQFILTFVHYLPFDIRQNWSLRYEKRVNIEDHFITDTKLLFQYQQAEFYIEATNLFNISYMDIPGIPLPGRWIIAGIKINQSF